MLKYFSDMKYLFRFTKGGNHIYRNDKLFYENIALKLILPIAKFSEKK